MADEKTKAPVKEAPVKEPQAPVQEPQVDATQQVETDAYVPKYKIKPEFKKALIQAIGKYPFNQTAQIFQAVEVEYIDHNQLNQVVNVLGNFPYQDVAGLMGKVTDLVEQVTED